MLRISFIALLICGIISFGYAQDSVKKTTPAKPQVVNPTVVKPPVAKPSATAKPLVVKPDPNKYKTYKYHTRVKPTAVSPAGTNPAVQQPVKPDTIAPPPVLTDKSLNGQYQYLLSKVYHYQQPLISALWKSASDTLNLNKHKLHDVQAKLNTINKTIDSLKADMAAKDQSLTSSNARVDAVDMFGIFLPKTTYNLIMWGLVVVFGMTAFIVIARSGSYSREAKYRVKLYNELEEEFKAYKTKANDKEKKLARELQTERNKVDELTGRA